VSDVNTELQQRYGVALLSRVTRFVNGHPDLASIDQAALTALADGAKAGREIPDAPGNVVATQVPVTFGGHRFEDEQGPDGEVKRFTIASMRWYGGDTVMRYRFDIDTWSFEPYEMVLAMDDDAVDLSRLNSGAPFLNGHNNDTAADVLGVIVEDSASLRDSDETESGREGIGEVRFSRREDIQPVVTDVLDGVLRQVSQGFDIQESHWEEREGKLRLLRVTKWAPYEVSLVPLGAAKSAQFFSAALGHSFQSTEGTQMPDKTPTNPVLSPEEKAFKEGARLEAARQAGIRQAANALRIEESVFAPMLADTELTIDAARAKLIGLAADRDDKHATPPAGAVSMGNEESVTMGAAITRGLLHRYDSKRFKLEGNSDPAAQFSRLSLHEIARQCLNSAGVDTRFMGRGEIARRAMQMRSHGGNFFAGQHSTSDFPLLLADAANKALQAAYKEGPQKWKPFTRIVNLPDLKERKVHQTGAFGTLDEVEEGGEYTYATFGEAREVWALTKFGKKFGITEETIINDDLDAFTRLPGMFGVAARNRESAMVWGVLIDNAAMSDGKTLFHADHGNLATAQVGAPDVDALSEALELMRLQTGLEGSDDDGIDVEPRFIMVRPQDEAALSQLLAQITPAQTSNVVPDWMRSLTPIVERRLGLQGRTAWYMAADPSQIDTIEAGWLQSEEGVQVSMREDWDHDGIEIKAKLRFGAKAVEHRGLFKNAGA
tara:strand:- start:1678 stop:3834 length:2157 start_codon:yes stop_codon:yes gene_type:complete